MNLNEIHKTSLVIFSAILLLFFTNNIFAADLPAKTESVKTESVETESAKIEPAKAAPTKKAAENQTQQQVAVKQQAAVKQQTAATQQIVAIMQMTFSGLNDKVKESSINNAIIKGIESAGHRVVSPQAVEEFMDSDLADEFSDCYSVACTAKAGKLFGVNMVVSGNVSGMNQNLKINLQLIAAKKGKVIATNRSEVKADAELAPVMQKAIKDLFSKVKAEPVKVAEVPKSGETLEQRKDKEERFYKGTLTTIGPLEIIPKNDRAGVILGYRKLGFNHYAHIEPQVDLRFYPDAITKRSKLRLGFGVPFNLQIFSGDDQNNDGKVDKFDIKLRSEDWDSWRDAFQIIRYIQYGRKEDNIYLNINRTFATSIGHGQVMKRYIPNLDYFTTRVSAEFDGYSKYGGAELFVNDITKANVISTLFFLKPGSFFSDHWMAESLSLGFHYSTDWDAPSTVQTSRSKSDGNYLYSATDIHFIGTDIELKVIKWPIDKTEVDLKLYFDYTKWLDNGSGITFGSLGRFNLYTKIRQAFRVRMEFRAFQNNYSPSYFDSFYEVMKYKWFSESKPPNNKVATDLNIKTKYNEFSNRSNGWDHYGMYFEFSYALLDYVALTVAVDKASGSDNGNFLFHIEVPATKYFQISATYYKVNFTSAKNIFDVNSPNTMFIALARLRPVQILSFQFGVRKTVQPSIIYFPNLESVWDLKADLDLSWEF